MSPLSFRPAFDMEHLRGAALVGLGDKPVLF